MALYFPIIGAIIKFAIYSSILTGDKLAQPCVLCGELRLRLKMASRAFLFFLAMLFVQGDVHVFGPYLA
ncbi:hypothetical protein PYR71_28375 [Rhizobium sp. MC63]|uniref:Uncharacterized protein n=4 Tax=Rhizobium TaxID=379 RepID=A0A1C3YA96_9HYPH|nr:MULTISPECIES: hypothetical protein [Rhizobium]ANK88264.1 hypothetical protein AMK02_PC00018 [Rhizobium sp. N731]ANL18510.1 hypothetical protein AMJ97_PC00018 [Rhizobium sp. N1314]ANL37100.1 hypothetical protein AMC89_PC00018 [Rhizobium phaseoli]ANL43478.1 hypothetical protein AMC88_PC00018 [Rhizobium phaseoli]ANL62464.1 hypothetical protein AMC85_PC00018 [Rhizobium phaseoli]